jgi:exopolysaccharide biosynthesis protein
VGNGAVPSTHVSGVVRRYECLAGINTAPFSPVSGREGEARTIAGLAVSDGILRSPPHPSYDALVFYKDRRAAIQRQTEIVGLGEVDNAAGGFYAILREGALPPRLLDEGGQPRAGQPRHPRSAGGLSADGKTLYLLVIDGRRPGSVGATEAETGLLLRRLGASRGINFDGGGSTALALRFPDGKVRPVNTPIHGGIPGRERGVAACLGIARAE